MQRLIHWLDNHNGLVTAIATVVIAVLTYYLAVYAGGQEHILKQQIADSQATQRAYVHVKEPKFETLTIDERGDKKPFLWRITMAVENSGTTPAKNATLFLPDRRLLSSDEPDHFEVDMSSYESIPIVLGPKSELTAFDWFMTPQMYADITKGTKNYYVLGKIRYADVFNPRESRVTKFCFKVIGLPWTSSAPKELFSLATTIIEPHVVVCGRNNCADAECTAQ